MPAWILPRWQRVTAHTGETDPTTLRVIGANNTTIIYDPCDTLVSFVAIIAHTIGIDFASPAYWRA